MQGGRESRPRHLDQTHSFQSFDPKKHQIQHSHCQLKSYSQHPSQPRISPSEIELDPTRVAVLGVYIRWKLLYNRPNRKDFFITINPDQKSSSQTSTLIDSNDSSPIPTPFSLPC